MNKSKKTFYIFVISFIIIGLVIMVMLFSNNVAKNKMLDKYGLKNLSVEEMVIKLDSIIDEEEDFKAKITPNELIIVDNGKTFKFAVPDDLFYLSFAPYIESTHPCATHSLVTCRGEMKNETFHVTVFNEDGSVIVTKEVTSMENGFIGVWLPKDINGKIVVNYDNLKAEAMISTSSTSDTCLTTPLKLS